MEIKKLASAALAWLLALLPFFNAVAQAGTQEAPAPPQAPVAVISGSLNNAIEQFQDPSVVKGISLEMRDHMLEMIERYGNSFGCDPESKNPSSGCASVSMPTQTQKGIRQAVSQIKKGMDPGLVSAHLFDSMTDSTKWAYDQDVDEEEISHSDRSRTFKITQLALGRTLGYKKITDLGYQSALITMAKDDPNHPGKRYVDVALIDIKKGAAHEQRVLYSQSFQTMLENLKNFYYRQCPLVRMINNGANPERLPNTSCKDAPGSKREGLSQEDIGKLLERYEKNRTDFTNVSFVNSHGQKENLLHYLGTLETISTNGTLKNEDALKNLNWRDLDAAKRATQKFLIAHKTEETQKTLLGSLTQYVSQVTGTTPAKGKAGNLGLGFETPEDLQKILTQFNEGRLSGHSVKASVDERSKQIVTARVLSASQGAMMALAYAAATRKRAQEPGLSHEEEDAALSAADRWTSIAQNYTREIQMENLAEQIATLKNRDYQTDLGLTEAAAQKEAQRLETVIRDQYLPELANLSEKSESLALQKDASSLYLGLVNASLAELYGRSLRRKLKTARADLEDMRTLYLAREFSKVQSQYKTRTSLGDMEGQGYQNFLASLSPEEERVSQEIESASKALESAESSSDDAQVRAQSASILRDRFPKILRDLGLLGLKKVVGTKEIERLSLHLNVLQSQDMAALQNFTDRAQAFVELNELDELIRENASSKPSLADPKTFWQKVLHFSSLRFMNSTMDAAEGFQRDRAAKILMAHNPLAQRYHWLTRAAWEKLKDNGPLRKQVLALMNSGDYGHALENIVTLDPEMAQKTATDYNADKIAKDPYSNLSFEGFMTNIPEDAAGVRAQGVIGDLFSYIKPLILGYQVATAVADTAAMSAYSTFIGGAAVMAESITQKIISAGQILRATDAADEASGLARLSRALDGMGTLGNWTKNFGGRGLEFVGRMMDGAVVNVKNVLGIEQLGAKGKSLSIPKTLAQIARRAPTGVLIYQAKNAAIMGGASGAMSAASYWWNPQTSQYESAGKAFKEGAVSGMSFGVKATPLMLANPIQASAFGVFGNGISAFVKSVAETPGFASWTIQSGAKLIPRWSESAVAESGPLGALQMKALDLSPALRTISKLGIWTGGMADGIGKYFLTSLGAQSLVERSNYLYHDKLAPLKDKPETGQTAKDRNIAASYQAGQAAGQISWLFLPTSAMGNSEQIKEQKEESDGFNILMSQGLGKEIEALPDDYSLTYEKPFLDMSWREKARYAFNFALGRKVKRAGTFKVNSQWRNEAAKKRLRNFSDAELAIISNADKKDNDLFFKFNKTPQGDLELAPVETPKAQVNPDKTELSDMALSKEEIAQLAKSSDLRLSNDLVSTAKNILESRVLKDPALREKIIMAENSAEIPGKDGSAVLSGPGLEKLKQIAATAEINSNGFARFFVKNLWNASLHLGRDLKTPQDIFIGQIANAVNKKSGAKLTETLKLAGDLPVSEALVKMEDGGEADRAIAVKKTLTREEIGLKGSVSETIDALNSKIKSSIDAGNDSRAQVLESAKDKLAQVLTDPEADSLIKAFHDVMDEKIAESFGAGRATQGRALQIMRKTIESDAYAQFIDKKLARDFNAYQKGKISQGNMDLSINLFKSIWERGIFGRYFGEWKTDASGERILEIPADRQLKDARGNPITSFRELQARQILSTLKSLSKGEGRIFNLLKTSGGKTLLSFVMLDFLDNYARSRGKLGGMYLTANGDLAAQTMDQYLALFNGRKPRFKIKTYSDFWAELAQADKYGGSNPLELYDMVLDEYDMMAMTTALSLGSFNGIVSRHPELDPVQASLKIGAQKIKELYDQYGKGGPEINPVSFNKLLNDNPQFKEAFDFIIADQTKLFRKAMDYAKSKAYRTQLLNSDSPLYKDLGVKSLADFKTRYGMTPEQAYLDLLKSHQHAFGGGAFDALSKKLGLGWGGVVGRQYGAPENWIEKIYSGGYQALSKKDLQNLFALDVDKNRQEVIQYFNGVPMDNLDTEYRSYLELLYGKPLTLDFDSLAVVDFASFNSKAKAAGSVMLGLSGTLAHSIKPFMKNKMGFSVIGDESAGYRVDYQILNPENTAGLSENSAREFILKDMLKQKPDLSILYADNKAEYETLRNSLKKSGVANDEITIGITPDSNFLAQNRRQTGVEEYKNLDALKSGKAKVLILVGQAGFRGLDLPFGKAYKNGKFRMYISAPENLATVNLKQLMGRIDSGRIPPGVKVTVTGVIDGKILENSSAYMEIARKRLAQAADDPQKMTADLWNKIASIVRENAEDPQAPISYKTVKRLVSDPKALENPDIVKVRDLLENYRVIKKLSHIATPSSAKELLEPQRLEHLEAFARNPKVADILIGDLMAQLQNQAEQNAVESSGINRLKRAASPSPASDPSPASRLRALFGRKKEAAGVH